MITYNVSIIIPIYNVENYLEDCIKSCLVQKDAEIILVDDGSTDRSSDICMRYIDYINIKYIRQDNMGLSESRNRGLSEASGKYILFVDSDDMIIPGTIDTLVNIASSNDSDVVLFNYETVTETLKLEDTKNNVSNLNINEDSVFREKLSTMEVLESLFNGEIQNYAWSMIVKRDIYINNNIKFPSGRLYEDIATTYLVIGNAISITKVPMYRCYLYRQRNDSITNTPSIKMAKDIVTTLHEIEGYLDEEYKNLRNEEYINFAIPLLFLAYSNIYDTNTNMVTKRSESKKIKSEILDKVNINSLRKIKGKYKMAYIFLRMGIFMPIQRLRKLVS